MTGAELETKIRDLAESRGWLPVDTAIPGLIMLLRAPDVLAVVVHGDGDRMTPDQRAAADELELSEGARCCRWTPAAFDAGECARVLA